MTSLSEKSPSTCPTCAFNQTLPGKISYNRDGSLVCGNCNTKWRDIGVKEINNPSPLTSTATNRSKLEPPHPDAISFPILDKTKSKSKIWQIAGVTCLTFVTFILVTLFIQNQREIPLNPSNALTRSNTLTLANISIKTLNKRGRRIWSISATIVNPTANRLNVPSLAFQAGKQGSSGYLQWIYQPAMQSLAPGTDFRFRTLVARPEVSPKYVSLNFVRQNLNPG